MLTVGLHELKANVLAASYPRSGHSLLVHFLFHYFGPDFPYCEFYKCCNCHPCKHGPVVLQKSHDFGLSINSQALESVIIQFRSPIPSFISNFELTNTSVPRPVERLEWEAFAVRSLYAWKSFLEKWAFSHHKLDSIYICYDLLISKQQFEFTRILKFLGVQEPDVDLINDISSSLNVKHRRKVTDFLFFDKEYFQWLEAQVEEIMQELRIPSCLIAPSKISE